MLNSTQLRQVVTEARPIIERMLNDAAALAGLRDVVAAAGGDWSQLKALLKAQIQDEEAGEDKRVRKVLEKAEYATAYADMLGYSAFSKMMNEEHFSDQNDEAVQ
jgi:thymidine phosphorylase